MGKIKELTTQKAEMLQWELASQAKARFYQNVMEWENCSYEEAVKLAQGETEPVRWDYTLGLKLCDPLMMMAMHAQLGKKARAQAVENFKATLTPEELKIYEEDVEPTSMGKAFRESLRRKKKHPDQERRQSRGGGGTGIEAHKGLPYSVLDELRGCRELPAVDELLNLRDHLVRKSDVDLVRNHDVRYSLILILLPL